MTDAFERAAQRTESEYRRKRRQHSARRWRKGFRIHATVFGAVQVLLVAVWALQWQLGGTSHPWFLYALFGWGVGLAVHYAVARDDSAAEDEGPSGSHGEPSQVP
jgi:2TM domain